MRKLLTILILTLVIQTGLRAQQRVVADKPIPIMAWAGIPTAEISLAKYQEMKEMGINICLSTFGNQEEMMKSLDLARQAGLTMITSVPGLKTETEKTVRAMMGHPALAGYFLRDEPVCSDMPALGEWGRKILDVDKNHLLFVNLIAAIHPTMTEALGAPSYADYVKTFIKEVPVQVLSFDFYPILNTGIHDRWYEGLEIFSKEARAAGKPFWAFALASSYNELHPVPTLPALRLQMFSNLAYGATGLEYWAYRQSDGLSSAPIGSDGRRTMVYDRIRQMNREVQALAGVFQGSLVVSVAHTGTVIPRGTSRLSDLPKAIRVFETEGSGALVSILRKGDQEFFVIINRNLEKNLRYTISGDTSLQRVLKDGTLVEASTYAPSAEIEPGDIAVYEYPSRK